MKNQYKPIIAIVVILLVIGGIIYISHRNDLLDNLSALTRQELKPLETGARDISLLVDEASTQLENRNNKIAQLMKKIPESYETLNNRAVYEIMNNSFALISFINLQKKNFKEKEKQLHHLIETKKSFLVPDYIKKKRSWFNGGVCDDAIDHFIANTERIQQDTKHEINKFHENCNEALTSMESLYTAYINTVVKKLDVFVKDEFHSVNVGVKQLRLPRPSQLTLLEEKYNQLPHDKLEPSAISANFDIKKIQEKLNQVLIFNSYIEQQQKNNRRLEELLKEIKSNSLKKISDYIDTIKNLAIEKKCRESEKRFNGGVQKIADGVHDTLNKYDEKLLLMEAKITSQTLTLFSAISDNLTVKFRHSTLRKLKQQISKLKGKNLLKQIISTIEIRSNFLTRLDNRTLSPGKMTGNDFRLLNTIIRRTNGKNSNYAKQVLISTVKIVSVKFETDRKKKYLSTYNYGDQYTFYCRLRLKNLAPIAINVQILLSGRLRVQSVKKKTDGLEKFVDDVIGGVIKMKTGKKRGISDLMPDVIKNLFDVDRSYKDFFTFRIPPMSQKDAKLTLWSKDATAWVAFKGRMENVRVKISTLEPTENSN